MEGEIKCGLKGFLERGGSMLLRDFDRIRRGKRGGWMIAGLRRGGAEPGCSVK